MLLSKNLFSLRQNVKILGAMYQNTINIKHIDTYIKSVQLILKKKTKNLSIIQEI